jgi:hypothetical protein
MPLDLRICRADEVLKHIAASGLPAAGIISLHGSTPLGFEPPQFPDGVPVLDWPCSEAFGFDSLKEQQFQQRVIAARRFAEKYARGEGKVVWICCVTCMTRSPTTTLLLKVAEAQGSDKGVERCVDEVLMLAMPRKPAFHMEMVRLGAEALGLDEGVVAELKRIIQMKADSDRARVFGSEKQGFRGVRNHSVYGNVAPGG